MDHAEPNDRAISPLISEKSFAAAEQPSSNAPWRRAEGVITCVAEDEVALLVRESWKILPLDETSQRIWDLLREPRTTGDLVAALVSEYAVSPEQCRADLEPLLIVLGESGALIAG